MEWHEFLVAAFAAIATTPLAFFLPNCPCCEEGCGVADGKPRTDPANEGTWVPSGTWRGVGGVTWSFTANPGDDSGETWFFYGSASTSKVGGGATVAEQQDWGNICNWYSNKTNSPSTLPGLSSTLNKRATRLPPVDSVVHIYTSVSTVTAGPQTVQYAYFWRLCDFISGSEITSTAAAHDSVNGAVFNNGSDNFGTVNAGATFNNNSDNAGTVNDGAVFNGGSNNDDTVNDGAVFNDSSDNGGTVDGGATFNDSSRNLSIGTVNGGATFNDGARNLAGIVNGGATFNDSSRNLSSGTVNGGATFNDAACSERTTGNFFSSPCDRKFVAHPTDLPVCNGTAPDGCANSADTCGCG